MMFTVEAQDEGGVQMIAIGCGELDGNPDIGATIKCRHCANTHDILYGTEKLRDGTERQSDLSYYKCGDAVYLAGFRGQAIFKGQ